MSNRHPRHIGGGREDDDLDEGLWANVRKRHRLGVIKTKR